jgi:hypothetical protein
MQGSVLHFGRQNVCRTNQAESLNYYDALARLSCSEASNMSSVEAKDDPVNFARCLQDSK